MGAPHDSWVAGYSRTVRPASAQRRTCFVLAPGGLVIGGESIVGVARDPLRIRGAQRLAAMARHAPHPPHPGRPGKALRGEVLACGAYRLAGPSVRWVRAPVLALGSPRPGLDPAADEPHVLHGRQSIVSSRLRRQARRGSRRLLTRHDTGHHRPRRAARRPVEAALSLVRLIQRPA